MHKCSRVQVSGGSFPSQILNGLSACLCIQSPIKSTHICIHVVFDVRLQPVLVNLLESSKMLHFESFILWGYEKFVQKAPGPRWLTLGISTYICTWSFASAGQWRCRFMNMRFAHRKLLFISAESKTNHIIFGNMVHEPDNLPTLVDITHIESVIHLSVPATSMICQSISPRPRSNPPITPLCIAWKVRDVETLPEGFEAVKVYLRWCSWQGIGLAACNIGNI